MKVGKEIALEAKKKGICKEWFSDMLKQNSIAPLCKMFFDGSDWAMENDFPNIELLRKFKGNSEQYGLYADFKGELILKSLKNQKAFFGESEVDLSAGDFSVSEIYIRHNSKAKIKVAGSAFMVVTLLDSAQVEIDVLEDANVSVFYYGTENMVKYAGNVKITEKSWER